MGKMWGGSKISNKKVKKDPKQIDKKDNKTGNYFDKFKRTR